MSRRLMVLMVALLATAGCSAVSGSRLNPFNWFGRSEEVAVSDAAPAHLADPRPLIDQVTALTVDPTPGGAILRATACRRRKGITTRRWSRSATTSRWTAFWNTASSPFRPPRPRGSLPRNRARSSSAAC